MDFIIKSAETDGRFQSHEPVCPMQTPGRRMRRTPVLTQNAWNPLRTNAAHAANRFPGIYFSEIYPINGGPKKSKIFWGNKKRRKICEQTQHQHPQRRPTGGGRALPGCRAPHCGQPAGAMPCGYVGVLPEDVPRSNLRQMRALPGGSGPAGPARSL